MNSNKKRILFLVQLSLPYQVSAIYFSSLLNFLRGDDEFKVIHIDTSDKRNDISNHGNFDLQNIITALQSLFETAITLNRENPKILYVPISQNTLAYFGNGLNFVVKKK